MVIDDLELANLRKKNGTDSSQPPSSSALGITASPPSAPLEEKESLLESFQKFLEKHTDPELHRKFLENCARSPLDDDLLSMLIFMLEHTKSIPLTPWDNQKNLMQNVLNQIARRVEEGDPLYEFVNHAHKNGCKLEDSNAMSEFKSPKKLADDDVRKHICNFFIICNSNFFAKGVVESSFNLLDKFSEQKNVKPSLEFVLLKGMSAGNNFKNLISEKADSDKLIYRFLSFLDQRKEAHPAGVLACLTGESGRELCYRITSCRDLERVKTFLALIAYLNEHLQTNRDKLMGCIQFCGFPILRHKNSELNAQFLKLLIAFKESNLSSHVLEMMKFPDYYHPARRTDNNIAKAALLPNFCVAVLSQADVSFKKEFLEFLETLDQPENFSKFIIPPILMHIAVNGVGDRLYECELLGAWDQLIQQEDWETLLFLFQNDFLSGRLLINSKGMLPVFAQEESVEFAAIQKSDCPNVVDAMEWLKKCRRDDIEKLIAYISENISKTEGEKRSKLNKLLQLLEIVVNTSGFNTLRETSHDEDDKKLKTGFRKFHDDRGGSFGIPRSTAFSLDERVLLADDRSLLLEAISSQNGQLLCECIERGLFDRKIGKDRKETGYQVLRSFGADVIGNTKKAVYKYIKGLENTKEKYQIVGSACKGGEAYPLGRFFKFKTHQFGFNPRSGVGTYGKLEKLYDKLEKIFGSKKTDLQSNSGSSSGSHSMSSSSPSSSPSQVLLSTSSIAASSSRFLSSSRALPSDCTSSSPFSLVESKNDSSLQVISIHEEEKIKLSGYIKELKKAINSLWKVSNTEMSHLAPEDPSVEPVLRGIEAHERRIEVLEKMRQGKSITHSEHRLLLKMGPLAEDTFINNYLDNFQDEKTPSPGVK